MDNAKPWMKKGALRVTTTLLQAFLGQEVALRYVRVIGFAFHVLRLSAD
jgi:hypothetical protein